jgi:hypothetical protein
MSGQAASYYDQGQGFDSHGQQQAPYENKNNGNYTNGYDQRGNGNYQPPVNYQQQQPANYQQPGPDQKPQQPPYPDNPPPYSTFDEAFKIEKPKYNDIWAGLLVSLKTVDQIVM